MDNSMFALAVSLTAPSDETSEKVRSAMRTFEDNGNLVFEYDPSQDELYDEMADDTGYLTLGILCKSDDRFYESDTLTQGLASAGEAEPDEIDYTFLPDIADFAEDEQSTIDGEISRIAGQFYAQDQQKETEETSEEIVEEPSQESDENVAENPVIEEAFTDIPRQVEKSPETAGAHFATGAPEGRIDPLLTLSADIFENNVQATLPVYDGYIREQLMPVIAEAQSQVHMARDQAIYSIYDILKEHKEEFKEKFDEKFDRYAKEHEKTLDAIGAKLAQETASTTQRLDNEYKNAQEEYVSSQAETLKAKYDSEHRQEHLDRLSAEISQLKKSATEKEKEEKSQYERHYNKESFKFINREMRKLDFSTIFNEFTDIVNEQAARLNAEAVDFKKEFGSVTERIVKERDDYKRKNEELSREVERLHNEWNATLSNATTQKAQELSTHKDALISQANATTAQDQQTINLLHSNLESLRNENSLLRERGAYNGFSQPQAQSVQPQSQPQIQAQTSVHQTAGKPKTTDDKQNLIKMIALGVVAAVAVIGVIMGISMIAGSHNSDTAPMESYSQKATSAETKTVPSSSAESVSDETESSSSSTASTDTDDTDTDESSEQYSSGSKWTYTKNGKNYEVTMDSPTTGTYIDEDGNTHKITLNE